MNAPAAPTQPTPTRTAPTQPAPRSRAEVDLDVIAANTALLARHAGGAEVMAVVKADGYGHGLVPSARAAIAGGASWLGVAFVEEALALRAAGLAVPVLAWLLTPGEPGLADAVAAGVDLSASAPWVLDELAAAASAAGRPVRAHLKADTGLSRGGATAAEWPQLCAAAARHEADGTLEVVGVWTHFVFADAPGHATTTAQVRRFREAVAVAEAAGLRPAWRHCANSAATLTLPAAHLDLVRPGIAVYGLSPVPAAGTFGLRPAMTLASHVALTKTVPAGTGVSYGHRYHTAAASDLALVPLGYADGVPRDATNRAPMQLGGRRRTVAGTVCMDQLVLDVGADVRAGRVRAGDEVLLFGPGDRGEPTAQDWADRLGTLSYEVVTRVGARVPRSYRGGDAP